MNIFYLYKRILLLGLTAAGLCIAVVSFAYCFILPQYSLYSGSLKYKKSLLDAIDTNKIIIVGDSNAGHSIFARILTEELGIKTVNCALARYYGHVFDGNLAFSNIKSGDIVIASYTDYCYNDEEINWESIWAMVENNFDTYFMLNGLDIPHLIYSFPQYIESAVLRFIAGQGVNGDDYHIDEFGDSDHKLDSDKIFTEDDIYLPKYNDRCINIMNNYNKKLKEKGVTLLVASAPIPCGEFSPCKWGG